MIATAQRELGSLNSLPPRGTFAGQVETELPRLIALVASTVAGGKGSPPSYDVEAAKSYLWRTTPKTGAFPPDSPVSTSASAALWAPSRGSEAFWGRSQRPAAQQAAKVWHRQLLEKRPCPVPSQKRAHCALGSSPWWPAGLLPEQHPLAAPLLSASSPSTAPRPLLQLRLAARAQAASALLAA